VAHTSGTLRPWDNILSFVAGTRPLTPSLVNTPARSPAAASARSMARHKSYRLQKTTSCNKREGEPHNGPTEAGSTTDAVAGVRQAQRRRALCGIALGSLQ
jgi:hypothetical protein